MDKTEIFLLTKPPHNDRAKLCFHLMEHSKNAVLYLAGDGVYNLLAATSLKALPRERIFTCKEDLEARGLEAGKRAIVPEDFYKFLVDDMISDSIRIYAF